MIPEAIEVLHLLVALRPEATPFARAWNLRRDPEVKGFDLYEGTVDDLPVRLVRTGIGKAQMAAAVGWLAGRYGDPAIWINVGIAGHGRRSPGDVILAHKVLDASNERTSYPPLVIEPPCDTCEVHTVDLPETVYIHNAAYDMEASAFFEAARRFATAEVVHCLKVVSDGPDAPIEGLNRQRIGELAENAVPVARELARRLRPVLEELRVSEDNPADYQRLVDRLHFTASDRVQLRKQLRRRQALAPTEPLPKEVDQAARGNIANRVLETWLDRRTVR